MPSSGTFTGPPQSVGLDPRFPVLLGPEPVARDAPTTPKAASFQPIIQTLPLPPDHRPNPHSSEDELTVSEPCCHGLGGTYISPARSIPLNHEEIAPYGRYLDTLMTLQLSSYHIETPSFGIYGSTLNFDSASWTIIQLYLQRSKADLHRSAPPHNISSFVIPHLQPTKFDLSSSCLAQETQILDAECILHHCQRGDLWDARATRLPKILRSKALRTPNIQTTQAEDESSVCWRYKESVPGTDWGGGDKYGINSG